MSILLISLLVTASGTTWLYSKFYRHTGGNNQSSIVGAGVAGAIGFWVIYLTLKTVIKQ